MDPQMPPPPHTQHIIDTLSGPNPSLTRSDIRSLLSPLHTRGPPPPPSSHPLHSTLFPILQSVVCHPHLPLAHRRSFMTELIEQTVNSLKAPPNTFTLPPPPTAGHPNPPQNAHTAPPRHHTPPPLLWEAIHSLLPLSWGIADPLTYQSLLATLKLFIDHKSLDPATALNVSTLSLLTLPFLPPSPTLPPPPDSPTLRHYRTIMNRISKRYTEFPKDPQNPTAPPPLPPEPLTRFIAANDAFLHSAQGASIPEAQTVATIFMRWGYFNRDQIPPATVDTCLISALRSITSCSTSSEALKPVGEGDVTGRTVIILLKQYLGPDVARWGPTQYIMAILAGLLMRDGTGYGDVLLHAIEAVEEAHELITEMQRTHVAGGSAPPPPPAVATPPQADRHPLHSRNAAPPSSHTHAHAQATSTSSHHTHTTTATAHPAGPSTAASTGPPHPADPPPLPPPRFNLDDLLSTCQAIALLIPGFSKISDTVGHDSLPHLTEAINSGNIFAPLLGILCYALAPPSPLPIRTRAACITLNLLGTQDEVSESVVIHCLESGILESLGGAVAWIDAPQEMSPLRWRCVQAIALMTWAKTQEGALSDVVGVQVVQRVCGIGEVLEGYLQLLGEGGSECVQPTPWLLLEYISYYIVEDASVVATSPTIGNSTIQDSQKNRPPLQIPPKSASITNIENKKKNLNVQIPPLENPMKAFSNVATATGSICSSVSSSPSTTSTCSTNLPLGSLNVSKLNQQSHTIESGLIENMTSKKKRGTTRENIILLDSILRERRDIFYAILNNVTKIRLYRKKRRNPIFNVSNRSNGNSSVLHTQTMTSPKEEFGNEYIVKLNNGLKCEAFETSTAQEYEAYGHKRQFKASMYYTQNEMDRLENQTMMDPSPLLREDRLSFLDQLHGLHKPSVQSYRVIDLIHPYHLFSTELEIIEPKSGRDLGRVMKKIYSLRTQYLIQTVEGVKKHSNGTLTSHEKYKYSTLFTITKHKHTQKKEEPMEEKHVIDQFQVRNVEGENVAVITRKFNEDYELKGYTSDYLKVNFLMETTPFERTLILSSLFLLDIEYFGN